MEWIKVNVDLPRDGEMVLACSDKQPSRGSYQCTYIKGVGFKQRGVSDKPLTHLTHWMPMPAPPTE